MINYYFKNRLVISVVFTIFAVFIAINFASNIASSIDQTASIVSNNDDIEAVSYTHLRAHETP